MPIRGNLKKRLQAGETVVGPFVIVPSVTMIDTLRLLRHGLLHHRH